MTARLRVKVSKAALLAKVQESRAKVLADYANAKKVDFPEQQAAFQAAAVKALESALAAAKTGKLPKHHEGYKYRYLAVDLPKSAASFPARPEAPNVRSLDRDIALIEMAADDTFTISTDDHFTKYL